jgi:hypothetical protein
LTEPEARIGWRTIQTAGCSRITDLTESDFRIKRPSDVLELVGAGVGRAILLDLQLHEDFFDLSTGVAGEVVQKCVSYGIRVAVITTAPAERSTHFRQFAQESTRNGRFVFAGSMQEALARIG